ncbi:hypothetical protein ACQKNX_17305 [Lysinibacillus sp. NPDC093712]
MKKSQWARAIKHAFYTYKALGLYGMASYILHKYERKMRTTFAKL